MTTYKVFEYSENAESSFLKGEFKTYFEARQKANEIGVNGEVWEKNDDEEVCILCNRNGDEMFINFEDWFEDNQREDGQPWTYDDCIGLTFREAFFKLLSENRYVDFDERPDTGKEWDKIITKEFAEKCHKREF